MVTNRIFLSTTVTIAVHVFPAASTLLQKALKVSLFTWANRLNSKFCIIYRIFGWFVIWPEFFRKWSHVQSLYRTFGSAAFQSWISLVLAKKTKFFFTLPFEIHMFFMNSTSVCAGSFFAVAVHFVIQASIPCFGGSGYCALY